MPKIVVLWSDVVVLATLALLVLYGWRIHASVNLRATWLKVLRDRAAFCSAVVLLLFFAVAVIDSFHFRRALADAPSAGAQQRQAYGTRTESLLDVLLAHQVEGRETSYSAPLAIRGFTKDSVDVGGRIERIYPRLAHGGEQLTDESQWRPDRRYRAIEESVEVGGVLLRTGVGGGKAVSIEARPASRAGAYGVRPGRSTAARPSPAGRGSSGIADK